MDIMTLKSPSLAIVVPCYNEKDAFPFCLDGLTSVLSTLISKGKISDNSYILFVDDGSKDDTWEQIKAASCKSSLVRGLKLSRNRGHQIALIAGLSNVNTDVTVSIDADLQDDINCIEKMIDKYNEGFEIVYGVRDNRDSDSAFKVTAALQPTTTTQATSSRRTYGGMIIMITPCPAERETSALNKNFCRGVCIGIYRGNLYGWLYETKKPKNGLRNRIKQIAPMTIDASVTAGV